MLCSASKSLSSALEMSEEQSGGMAEPALRQDHVGRATEEASSFLIQLCAARLKCQRLWKKVASVSECKKQGFVLSYGPDSACTAHRAGGRACLLCSSKNSWLYIHET